LHDRRLPGTPDLVLPGYRAVVFVNGCFWHRHIGCRYAATPSTRPEFWATKFASNVARDRLNSAALIKCGWRVLTIWECEVREELVLDRLFWRVVAST
jgi:DNA mismatch endonuclease (patch repair protein)